MASRSLHVTQFSRRVVQCIPSSFTRKKQTRFFLASRNCFVGSSFPPLERSCHRQKWTQLRTFWNAFTKKGDDTIEAQVLSSSLSSPSVTLSSLSSKAVVLKQRDEDLSPQELALKVALKDYQALLDKNSIGDNEPATNDQLKKSLESLRDCLEELEYWEDALQVELELEWYANSALEMASCIFRQGKLYMRMEDIGHGNVKYQKALELYQMEHGSSNTYNNNNDAITYHPDIGNVMVAMAGIDFARGNIDECLQTLNQAEDHFRKHDGQQQNEHCIGLVRCLDNQGTMYKFKQENQTALDKYEEALLLLGDADFDMRQRLQIQTTDLLATIDDIDGAILYAEKVLKEDRQRRGSEEETALDGVILKTIGVLHSQQKKLGLAEQELTKALEITKRFGGETHLEVARILNSLGSVHGVAGDKRKAYDCFQQALIVERIYAEDDNDPQILHILRNLAVLSGEKVPKWEG